MFERLFVRKYPTVAQAMGKNKACVRLGEDAFLIKNSIGLADSIEQYTRNKFLVSCNDDRDNLHFIRKSIVSNCREVTYPSVVWFNFSDVAFMPVQGAIRIPE
jgi:hypothetical protein